jgi:putative spermidine/putrescine transport system permease protein
MPRWLAAALIAPLLLLIGGAFLLPLGLTLARAVQDPELEATLPETGAALARWDGTGTPDEATFATLVREAASALEERRLGALATRLNFERTGLRAALLRVARAGDGMVAPFKPATIALDPRWGEAATWALLARAAGPATDLYLLRALDLTRGETGAIAPVHPDQALFRTLFLRTLWVSVVVTLVCLLLGYPVAAMIAQLAPPWSSLAMALVLIPFWSSVMVRSTAWFALLAREGPVNQSLLALGLLDAPLQMVGTRFAMVLATIHVLLPVAILPMVAVMARLDRRLLHAASSLGAGGMRSFLRVWLPLTLPGVLAGGAMVFLLAVGFYITPALIGGERDQLLAWFIAQFLARDVNWGMAAALSVYLLAMAGVVLLAARLLLGRQVLSGMRA